MTDKPDTLFVRHPRPWRVEIAINNRTAVLDANGTHVCRHDSLVDLINADAPKPFVPGWYWTDDGRGDKRPWLIDSKQLHDEIIASRGWTIGKRIEPEF